MNVNLITANNVKDDVRLVKANKQSKYQKQWVHVRYCCNKWKKNFSMLSIKSYVIVNGVYAKTSQQAQTRKGYHILSVYICMYVFVYNVLTNQLHHRKHMLLVNLCSAYQKNKPQSKRYERDANINKRGKVL